MTEAENTPIDISSAASALGRLGKGKKHKVSTFRKEQLQQQARRMTAIRISKVKTETEA